MKQNNEMLTKLITQILQANTPKGNKKPKQAIMPVSVFWRTVGDSNL